MIQPVWEREREAAGLIAALCAAGWLRAGSIAAMAWDPAGAGACTAEAGSTPRMPLPVPKLAGCGGISGLEVSTARAITALEVSATSARGVVALVIGGADCAGPAAASLIWPALTCTVFTLTGFIGSAEPGITAIGWVWITPLVSGAGSARDSFFGSYLACASILAGGVGRAAAAAAISDAFAAGRVGAAAAAAAGSEEATIAPLT